MNCKNNCGDRTLNPDVAALVLAGGRGSRFGSFKPTYMVSGKMLLEYLLNSIHSLYKEIIVVVGTDLQREQIQRHLDGLTIITDRVSEVGPLGGIMAGASCTRVEYCQILPADSPLPNRRVLNYLASCVDSENAVVPVWPDGRLEPLHGVYRAKKAATEAEVLIAKGDYAVISLVRALNARTISIEELRQFDMELETFLNVNTREDIDKIAGKLPHTRQTQ